MTPQFVRQHNEHEAFWRSLPDHEFFGPRVHHVYFYSDVNDESVLTLRTDVLDACRATVSDKGVRITPKPIVIHVCSRGGQIRSMQWLMSLFNQVDVPICTMVDALSASAATCLTVMAPYRVATEHSMTLIHDYHSLTAGKREALVARQEGLEMGREQYKQILLARTRLTDAALEEMLRRDMWLDAETCMKSGLIDRVIRPDRRASVAKYMESSKMAELPARTPLSKMDFNSVFATCTADMPKAFDALMCKMDDMKPIVFVTPGGSDCGTENDPMISLAMIARIQSAGVPVFGVVDNAVSWWELLPVLFCHHRYMYSNATVVSDMAYTDMWGMRLRDIIHNTTVMRKLITDVVKLRARPTSALLADMFDRTMTLSANECHKNGMVDEVVELYARIPTHVRPAPPPAPSSPPPPPSSPPSSPSQARKRAAKGKSGGRKGRR